MIIVMLGSPGVGKGTVSEILSNDLKFVHISTGELVREEIKNRTDLGKIMLEYSSKGELVPTKYITKIMKEVIEKNKDKNIILDGYPRSLEQAEELEKFAKIDKVINLVTKDEVILERLSFRRVCDTCGQIYHLKYFPPKFEGLCDNDQTRLVHRNDDKPEVIKERLKVYKTETQPLEDYYKETGILKEIDASGKPKEIAKLIKEVITI